MANGLSLLDPENSQFLELAQRYFVLLRDGYSRSNQQLAFKSIADRVKLALAVADVVMSMGCNTLEEFGTAEFAKVKATIPFGFDKGRSTPISSHRIREILKSWMELHDLFVTPGDDGFIGLNDGFPFPLFTETEAARIAGEGTETGLTADIPPEVAFAHIDAAIEYVAIHAKGIISLSAQAKAMANAPRVYAKAGQGERKRQLAAHLLSIVDGNRDYEFFRGNLNFSRIARELDLRSCNFDPLLCKHANRFLLSDDPEEKVEARTALQLAATKQAPAPAKYRKTYLVQAELGLPYVGQSGAGYAPWPITHVGNMKNGSYTVEAAEHDLLTAIIILIAAFDAGRIDEILTMDVDCLVEGADGFYLKTRLFKENDPEGGSVHLKPCPPVVVSAINLALDMGREARERHGSRKLFFSQYRGKYGVPTYHTFLKRMKDFSQRTGVAATGDGGSWEIAPHQLRRFFVTMWNHYFEYGGQYESCRRILGHAWIGTTIRYGRSATAGKALLTEQRRLTHKVLKSAVFKGLEDVRGAAAHRLVRVFERMSIRTRSEEDIDMFIERRIDHKGAEVHGMPWGYCIWDVAAGLKARCARGAARGAHVSRPDTWKKPEECQGCACFWTDEKFAGFWEHAVERHERVAAKPRAPRQLVEAAKAAAMLAKRMSVK
ncbi:site-specific integrase [Rhizobium laguerreae]|uniref:site-specific integrase n=1 Tax=Rhizobium laguerreae TaxID=1076926 RepID=UPI00144104C7|nr:site-specific integrase [Rhizobium laguerreae]NKM28634.1 hypothetical protein [Rhizobium laguerreae]